MMFNTTENVTRRGLPQLIPFWGVVALSNILTAGIVFGLMVVLKAKEVQRRDQLVMTVLVGDFAVYKNIKNGRVDAAKRILVSNMKLVASARNEFSPFGYYAWDEMDEFFKLEGVYED